MDLVSVPVTPSWFPGTNAEAPFLEQVASRRQAYGAALDEVLDALWDQNVLDAATLELCRLRIGQLLGAAPEPQPGRADPTLAADLAQWPTDPRFDRRLRTVLGYAEQVLLDAQEVTDAQADQVIEQIGEDGFLLLTYACGLFETTQRAEMILAQRGSSR
jgi:alkylhydroperoxidase family enzyme